MSNEIIKKRKTTEDTENTEGKSKDVVVREQGAARLAKE
jgi:hypothetical protein